MRGSVRSQTDPWRVPGKEVDHAGGPRREFAALAARWRRAHRLGVGCLLRSKRCVGGVHMLGEPYHTSWARFHRREACLEPIGVREHQEKTRARHRQQHGKRGHHHRRRTVTLRQNGHT